MTAPLAGVMSRIAAIRDRMATVAPSPTPAQAARFEAMLERASRPDAAARARGLRGESAPTVPQIGILGTPVITKVGAAAWGAPVGDVGDWASALPSRGQTWASAIETAAAKAGLDPRLLAAMVWTESEFTPDAVSRSGAIGLTQLMPATAEGLGVDPHDPIENLDGGSRYLAWTIDEFGSLELGLAAYNAGPGRVREAGGIPDIPETQAYVPKVLGYYRRLGGTP